MSYKKNQRLFYSFSTKSLLIIGLLLIVISVYLATNFYKNSNIVKKEATLLLSFENEGKGRMFQGEVTDEMTILDALIASSGAGQIKLRYSLTVDNKVSIEGIDDYVASESDKKITAYINSKRIDIEDINHVNIGGGDRIEFRLE